MFFKDREATHLYDACLKAIIGVPALEMLDRDTFELRTIDDLRDAKLGWRQRLLLQEYATKPLDKPILVTDVEKKINLTSLQASKTLDSLVDGAGGSGQVLTKYKTQHLIEYKKMVDAKRTNMKKGWVYEEIQGLTEAIDDLSILYERMVARFPKHPWNYVPLFQVGGLPVYRGMQFEIKRNELSSWR